MSVIVHPDGCFFRFTGKYSHLFGRGLRGQYREANMGIKIEQADAQSDASKVRELYWEYLEWANALL